jgi:hypothetical protein
MGLCSPGARAVDMQSAFNVGSGFGFSGGAAAQGNSSVKDNYLLSNSVSKSVIAFTRLTSLSPLRSHLSYPPTCASLLPSPFCSATTWLLATCRAAMQ